MRLYIDFRFEHSFVFALCGFSLLCVLFRYLKIRCDLLVNIFFDLYNLNMIVEIKFEKIFYLSCFFMDNSYFINLLSQ